MLAWGDYGWVCTDPRALRIVTSAPFPLVALLAVSLIVLVVLRVRTVRRCT
jgi:hypothetical protein